VKALAVRLSAEAAAQLDALGYRKPRMRQALRVATGRLSQGEQRSGPVTVRSALDIAACEVRELEHVLLVYAVIPLRDVRMRLWGEEIHQRLWDREHGRLMHGRWYPLGPRMP
jgi:hypothetical protein